MNPTVRLSLEQLLYLMENGYPPFYLNVTDGADKTIRLLVTDYTIELKLNA
jgi:hypothetical protein